MRTVIERNEHAELGSGVKQSALRFGSSRTACTYAPSGIPVSDCGPGFSKICRFENVRLEIVEFMPIDRDVGGVGVVR